MIDSDLKIERDLLKRSQAILDAEISALQACLISSNSFEEFRNKYVDMLRKGLIEEPEPLKGYAIFGVLEEGYPKEFVRDNEGRIKEFDTIGEAEWHANEFLPLLKEYEVKDLSAA